MHPLIDSAREFRLRPGRYLASLVAIIVAVGFLTATQVYGATESATLPLRQALYTSRADAIVETHLGHSYTARTQRDNALDRAEELLAADPRVAEWARFSQMYTKLSSGHAYAGVMLATAIDADDLRWFDADEGRLPQTAEEILLTRPTAERLDVGIGDTVQLNFRRIRALTVVGLSDDRGYADPPAYITQDLLRDLDASFPPPEYRTIVDPDANAKITPGSSGDGLGIVVLVRTTERDDAAAVASEMQQTLSDEYFLTSVVEVKTARQMRADVLAAHPIDTRWTEYLLTGIAAIALLVGGLIIATTFAILALRRRRQTGLLRAVGATRGQVMRRFLGEALWIGVIGSALGVALGIGVGALMCHVAANSLRFGLAIPWAVLALVFAAGVLVTVAAALWPVARAARVPVVEALSTAAAESGGGRGRWVSGVVAALVLLGGAAALSVGLVGSESDLRAGLVWAIAGSAAIALALVVAAPLYVPWLARGIGAALRWAPPTLRLALGNVTRNPGRTGATAAALMLAVGLIVTVQVGASSARTSAFAALDERYPADVVLLAAAREPDLIDPNGSGPEGYRDENGFLLGFSDDALDTVLSTPGVANATILEATQPLLIVHDYNLGAGGERQAYLQTVAMTPAAVDLMRARCGWTAESAGLSRAVLERLDIRPGDAALVGSLHDSVQLTAIECELSDTIATLPNLKMRQLDEPRRPAVIIAKLENPDDAASVIEPMTAAIMASNPGTTISGGAQEKANMRALLDDIALALSALLGVAAVVALVGVSNTLGLSVAERTRELGLLRALGLGRAKVGWMLVFEAVTLCVVSITIGVGAGIGFGWAGALAATRALGLPEPTLTIDWGQVVAMCGIVLAAGVLAAVLPAWRAARISPTEALADD